MKETNIFKHCKLKKELIIHLEVELINVKAYKKVNIEQKNKIISKNYHTL